LASATSSNFLAKWDVSLLNDFGVSMTSRKFERAGEKFADNDGWGVSHSLAHDGFLKQAKDSGRITIVCKAVLNILELRQAEESL
jgi:hypothetical protein